MPPAAAFGFLEAGAEAASRLGHSQREALKKKKKKRRGRGYRGIEIRIISERLVIIGRSLSALGVSGTPSCWKGSLPSVSSEPIWFFFFHWKGHCIPASVRQIGVNQDLISFSFGGGVCGRKHNQREGRQECTAGTGAGGVCVFSLFFKSAPGDLGRGTLLLSAVSSLGRRRSESLWPGVNRRCVSSRER